jgi:D-serine deaminase-like pyridoxal phosphate-dependent protein
MEKNLIKSPTLLLDVEKCRKNIARMADKAKRLQLAFRPHFKTHQSALVSGWLKEEGVQCCTVSSVKMARYFADNDWHDILIAFPANPLEHEAINRLAKRISLQLLVYDVHTLEMLEHKLEARVGIKIELDLGSRRSGLLTNQNEEINDILAYIMSSPNFYFTGFYSHPGHTYTARGKEEVQKIYNGFLPLLDVLEKKYKQTQGFSITIGDTPGCTIIEDFGPIKEISPGNFVFYDAMQVNIGSCTYDDIAVVMACPVVGKNKERNELLIHGGAVHFSKEVLTDNDGTTHFGKLAFPTSKGWEGTISGCYLKSISQEHGLVHATAGFLSNTGIGSIIYIYPAHSCLTADLVKSYMTTTGESLRGVEVFMP